MDSVKTRRKLLEEIEKKNGSRERTRARSGRLNLKAWLILTADIQLSNIISSDRNFTQ